jgi:hypothetical protein
MRLHKIILITLVVLAVGCKKDDDNGGTNNNGNNGVSAKTKLMALKPWIQTASTFTTAANPQPEDDFVNEPACSRDDIYIFKEDFTRILDEGAVKCDPSGAQSRQSTWAFKDSETKLLLGNFEVEIVELTETTLKYKYVIANTYTYTDVFKHQ